jgi:hypothetical protein
VGSFTATVGFTPPTAIDSCDGPVEVTCNPPPGSQFASGTTNVQCSATNSCGVPETCSFDVTVIPSKLTVDLQLQPSITAGARQRCITFDLWDCATGEHAAIDQTVTFNNGAASGVILEIPGGTWDCVMARDKLHTLRSKAPNLSTTDFMNYFATLMGSPTSGGHWLVGGNLNDDGYIDVQDYVRFLAQYLAAPSPNTPCGTLPYHADINASGTVDVADLSFIQVSMFQASEPVCCGSTAAMMEPVSSISVKDLRRMGLGHLSVADLNGDDVLDVHDIDALVADPEALLRPREPEPDRPLFRPLDRDGFKGIAIPITERKPQKTQP